MRYFLATADFEIEVVSLGFNYITKSVFLSFEATENEFDTVLLTSYDNPERWKLLHFES